MIVGDLLFQGSLFCPVHVSLTSSGLIYLL